MFTIRQLTPGKFCKYNKKLNLAKNEKYIIKQAKSLYNSGMPENRLGMQKLKKPCKLTQSLCARFVQNVDLWQKNHGKIDGKNSFWKRPGEGPRKAAAEGKNNKKNGPRAALWGYTSFFWLARIV